MSKLALTCQTFWSLNVHTVLQLNAIDCLIIIALANKAVYLCRYIYFCRDKTTQNINNQYQQDYQSDWKKKLYVQEKTLSTVDTKDLIQVLYY